MRQQLPARVYWVRRALVLVVLGIVVLVVWLVVQAMGGPAAPAAAPTTARPSGTAAPATPRTTPKPTSTSTPYPGGVTDCPSADVAVTIVPAAPSFAAGVSPTFTLTITNNGGAACLVDAGDTHRAIVVTSGTDRIWSNQDCAAAGSDPRTLLLAPKQTDTTQLAWNRVRSAQGCPSGLPAPAAGTYVATFSAGGATGAPAVFTLG